MFTVSNIISRVQREKQSVKIMEKYVFCEKTKIHRVLISTLKEKKNQLPSIIYIKLQKKRTFVHTLKTTNQRTAVAMNQAGHCWLQ